MKLFIDTANIEEIREMSQYGILKGCTTNPSLIAKEGRELRDVIEEITTLLPDGAISAEVTEGKAEDMVNEARELVQIRKNVVIKLPMTLDGIKACSILSKEGIKTNVTLVFSVPQALLAFEAGATYISPFLGRMDDAGFDSTQFIQDVVDARDNGGYETEIIAASVRNVAHVTTAALAGCDIATIPYKVLVKMVEHPLTTKGLKIFADAGKK